MCDYSLHHVASRPAKIGDQLVTTSFRDTSSRGFTAIGEAEVAVCLLPGTEIAFEKDVEYDDFFGLFSRKLREKVARFRQIDMDRPHNHHDALEFPSGRRLLLTQLCKGQRAAILQLPASTHAARTAEDEGVAEGRQRAGAFAIWSS